MEDKKFVEIFKELYPKGYESFVVDFERHEKLKQKREKELSKNT